MTVLITLTTAGTDSGPFTLYTNIDGYVTPFEIGVSKAALLAGYISTLVPDYATTIRVKSTGSCVNHTDITLVGITTTTTTTTLPVSYIVNVTTDSWADNASACANYLTIDLALYSPDSVITPGSTILYTDLALTTTYNGLGLYHITSYGGIVSIVIEATGLVTEYGTVC